MPMLGESPGATAGPYVIDLNRVGDTFVPVPFNGYIPRRMTVYGASTNLGASAATLGAYTGAAATGTTISPPDVLHTLSNSTAFSDLTVTAVSNYLTPTAYTEGGQLKWGLFVYVGVAHGSAANVKVLFELEAIIP